jgi:hypothetical protein
MSVKRKCKVVMLPTNEKAQINLYKRELRFSMYGVVKSDNVLPQHLYILSDEEIKEGSIFIANQGVFKCLEIVKGNYPYKSQLVSDVSNIQFHSKHWRNNVIATTDSSLGVIIGDKLIDIETNTREIIGELLPQPSQAFIEKFVEAYNSGNPITDVLVEYEQYWEKVQDEFPKEPQFRLKVNPKDSTITITKVKDSWSRKEVLDLIYKALGHFAAKHDIYIDGRDITKWTNENL